MQQNEFQQETLFFKVKLDKEKINELASIYFDTNLTQKNGIYYLINIIIFINA